MTIFSSANPSEYESRTLEIKEHVEGVNFYIQRPSAALGTVIDAAAIPAVALGSIKAAGVKPLKRHTFTRGTPAHLASIAADLESYIENRDRAAERAAREAERVAALKAEKEAAEAADLAELEAEAVSLYLAFYPDSTVTRIGEFDSVKRARWINTARHARELHAKP